ncbi:WXG100 family type VII secretion target [Paenibacillus campinasensis]|nr:polymorphic toxin type 28 domain-containing protein [Paenibacillus campinasensis]
MIHTLNQSIHTLASGWEGTTRSRFYADFQRAHREMTQTTEHIQRTSLELKAIAQRFKAADERVQPIQVAGHTLGAFPMMRGPAGYRAVDNAGRKVEESWNAVQQEAGEFWEGLKIGAMQFGSSLKDTAISLFEDPLGTGKSMLYNATIGTAEDIRDTAIWAGRMLFSNEYRDKVVEDTMQEVEAAGGWSTYLGTQSAMIIGGALLNRAGLRGGGPRNNKHDDLGGGNSGGSGSGNGGSDRGSRGNSGGNSSGDGDGKKSGDVGTGKGGKIISSVDDLSEVAKSKITTSQRATLNQQERTYSHLTEMDLKGAQRDLDGAPVPKPGGGYYDHAQEVSDAYRGLVDLKRSWEGMLKNPNLDDELRQLYTSKLNEVNATMEKVETMFSPHGGVFPPK